MSVLQMFKQVQKRLHSYKERSLVEVTVKPGLYDLMLRSLASLQKNWSVLQNAVTLLLTPVSLVGGEEGSCEKDTLDCVSLF